jgi:ATP-dependent protease ClpP protease subunit
MYLNILFFSLYFFIQYYAYNYPHVQIFNKNLIIINKKIDAYYSKLKIDEIKKFKNTTVKIFFDSNGGCLKYGYDIILMMDKVKKKNVFFECYAINACSISFDIFQRCDIRYTTPTSYLMQHSARVEYDLDELVDIINSGFFEDYKIINDSLDKYASKKANISYNLYKKLIKYELKLYGTNILKNKFSDKIVIIDDIDLIKKK